MQDPEPMKGDLVAFFNGEGQLLIEKHLKKKVLSFRELIKDIQSYLSKNTHARDILEGFSYTVQVMAKFRPEILAKALDDESLPADSVRLIIASALGREAKPNDEIIEALGRASTHENAALREYAVRALVEFQDKRTYDTLRLCLQDRRCPKGAIYAGISDPDFFDFPVAIKAIRRRVQDKEYEKWNPEAWSRENKLLEILESRPHNARYRRRKPKPPGDPPCSSPSKKS